MVKLFGHSDRLTRVEKNYLGTPRLESLVNQKHQNHFYLRYHMEILRTCNESLLSNPFDDLARQEDFNGTFLHRRAELKTSR